VEAPKLRLLASSATETERLQPQLSRARAGTVARALYPFWSPRSARRSSVTSQFDSKRREFLVQSGVLISAGAAGTVLPARSHAAPGLVVGDAQRPLLAQGIQIGDVLADRAIVWSRADRPARLLVEWDLHPRFVSPRRVLGPHALEASDYTARIDLTDLPRDREIFLRVSFQGLQNERAWSEPAYGRFRSAPRHRGNVRFVWGGDTAGQGFGINPEFGGMRIYETMRQRQPDFFLHSGDTIYADGPIPAEKVVEDGKVWRNLVTPEKSKVAETLDEFRGNYKYNLLDENVRRFNAEVPQIWQWDDHEVTNNWSPSKDLSQNASYVEKNVPLLVARGTKAFLEYAPLRPSGADESERVYRHIPYGKLLDVFVIDMRSYRGPNTSNDQTRPDDDTALLGASQLEWLKRSLLESRATWKVIASDMPIGLIIGDGKDESGRDLFEAVANGDGPVRGRELEIAGLLRFIKRYRISNVVWLTADVHYCAAHHYDPSRAQFQDFEPFWEFVAGPLHAGSFGPNKLENTFGPEVVFERAPPAASYSPFGGYQFFGQVDIDERTSALTVQLVDLNGQSIFERTLEPAR
jgi:alkaline phosphatase D